MVAAATAVGRHLLALLVAAGFVAPQTTSISFLVAASWATAAATPTVAFASSAIQTTARQSRLIRQQHGMIAPQQLGSFEPLTTGIAVEQPVTDRRVLLHDWTKCTTQSSSSTAGVEFTAAWNVQKRLLQGHLDRLIIEQQQQQQDQQNDDDGQQPPSSSFLTDNSDNNGIDSVIFLEHEPVYTLGTASDESFVKEQQQQPPSTSKLEPAAAVVVPVIRMDRGGEVTYHGPGQLTVYPVIDLRGYKQDIHWYVRALEEVVLIALQECGLETAVREPDVTGVWIDDHKVAAVGVKCKKWITQHGLAINVTPESLDNFQGIVPCGLPGRKVGCVNQFLAPDHQVTVQQMATYVKSAMEDVFRIQLVALDDETSNMRPL